MSPRRTTPWPAGTPCWIDLATPDLDGAKAFYSGLFGWEYDAGDPQYGGYSVASLGGATVSGVAPVRDAMPAAWTLYFATDDVAASQAAIVEHGGQAVMDVMQIGPMGSMTMGLDPSGASFGLWQAGRHVGTQVYNEPGGLSWEDLRSTDPDPARAFYAGLLGWTYRPLPMAGPDYTTIHVAGGDPVGGLGGMMGMEGFPSHWLVYLAVADSDAAVAYTEAHGGHVLSPSFDTEFGRMAALTDPYGAAFWVVQLPAES